MQVNRRRADLQFKIDTFVEKKNCLRCYRLHKKCDGGTPSCSGCSKSKAACIYTYNAAENKLNTLDTSKVDLEINVANLQQNLEQQKQAYQILQEQFEQIKAQNMTLQNMNICLSQALSAKVLQENHLAAAAEKQDLLGIYRETGYFYIRVTPLFNDVYQYMQEKATGRNPLKVASMDLVFSAVYMLMGKTDQGHQYINSALSVMMANNLNSPLGLICSHMMAENLFIAGRKSDCTGWLQKTQAMFHEMETNLTDPNKAQLVNNQMIMLAQVMDINFAKSVSIIWTQWVPHKVTNNQRIDQYLKQLEITKTIENSLYQSICSPCGTPTFYVLKTFSEIIIALEHQIDRPNEIPIVTEQAIITHFSELTEYSRMTSEPKMRRNFTRGVLVLKMTVAVITANCTVLDQLMLEMMESGCFDDECPSPHDSMPLFILVQLLCYLQSPYLATALQKYEKWGKSFPVYTKFYKKWVDISTAPSIYPVQLNDLEAYFLLLPHLYYMKQHNITFNMQLPIFDEYGTTSIDVAESLLLTPFDTCSASPHTSTSEKSSSENEPCSESSVFGNVTYAFTPVDFSVNDYEIENIVHSL